MQIATAPTAFLPMRPQPPKKSEKTLPLSQMQEHKPAPPEQLPEGLTGPILASRYLPFLAKLKPGKVKTFLVPNINIDNRALNEPVSTHENSAVIVFYTHLKDYIKVTLKQVEGSQFTPFETTLKLPLETRAAWPQVEIARTKGDKVLVVDDLSVNLRAILHSVTGSAKFIDPQSGQMSLKIKNLNANAPLLIPTSISKTQLQENPQTYIKQAIIPSAGLGTRLQPYAPCKPLIELAGGKTLIEHLVETCIRQGIERILIPVHQDMEKTFQSVLQPYILKGQVKLLPESLSGDAGGLLRYLKNARNVAKPFIRTDEPLLQIFGDAITGLNINRIATKWNASQKKTEKPAFVSLITRQYPDDDKSILKKYGFVLTEKGSDDGAVAQLLEKPGSLETILEQGGIYGKAAVDSGKLTVHAGMSILSPDFLRWMSQDVPGFSKDKITNFGQLFFHALKEGEPLQALSMEESWIDGGNGIDLNRGRAEVLQGKIPTSISKESMASNIDPDYRGVFFNQDTHLRASRWINPFKGNTTIQRLPNHTILPGL